MSTTLLKGDLVACPYCHKLQEDPIEDFVAPNRIGIPNDEECVECFEFFKITQTGDLAYEVRK